MREHLHKPVRFRLYTVRLCRRLFIITTVFRTTKNYKVNNNATQATCPEPEFEPNRKIITLNFLNILKIIFPVYNAPRTTNITPI